VDSEIFSHEGSFPKEKKISNFKRKRRKNHHNSSIMKLIKSGFTHPLEDFFHFQETGKRDHGEKKFFFKKKKKKKKKNKIKMQNFQILNKNYPSSVRWVQTSHCGQWISNRAW